MEYTITSFANGYEENENERVEVTGDCGDLSVKVELPYDYAVAKRTRVDGTLLVAVAKPGLLGWIQRKIVGW